MTTFTGLSAFPITPTDDNGDVLAEDLARLLARIGPSGARSIGLLGSTGGYVFLSRAERRRAVEIAVEAQTGLPLIVGAGALRTDDAVALARDAAQAGADALLLAPVSYTPLTDDEVYRHFLAVAGATDLPICIYNNPGTTHFTFRPALLARLAQIPTVAAVKMPLPADDDFGAEIARLRHALPEEFAIGYSGDWGCAEALRVGADAWYSVVGGLLPKAAARLADAARAGDGAAQDAAFGPLWALFREFGSIRVVYAAANLLGLTQAQPPRPILPLATPARDRIAKALEPLRDG